MSRGGQHLGLLGIFSTNSVVRLEKSPNRLRYFPTRGNIRTCVSIKSVVHCRALYTSPTLRLVFYDYREVAMDGWTKGGIEVVYWSVPSFQHTIYPPKSPSLFSLLHLPLISFSCRCSQYYFKRLMVSADSLHHFLADCPCLVGVKARRK